MDTESTKATILIVDDNPTNISVILRYLRESGYRTLIARSGEAALQQASLAKPDIILLDVIMPGIDGFETCKRLKENLDLTDIPVIYMTARSETIDKIKGFETGAVDYVTKPFQLEEVMARIETHLTIVQQKKELSRVNTELLALNSELLELNATKDRFFSIIAHDMRNVLHQLTICSDFLIRLIVKRNYEKIEDVAHDVKSSVKTAQDLLENLLSWSRSQIGAMKCEPENIRLHSVAESCIDVFSENARQKKIDLIHHIDADIFVYADPHMTNMVLRNLISNAIKFCNENDKVNISASRLNDYVEVSVSDTGVGIAEENIKRLFRIDKKFRCTGTAGEEGTGLGLILCKEFINKNGGKIWVESNLNAGTKIFFTLPPGK